MLADKIKDARDWLVEKFDEYRDGVTFIFGNPGDRGFPETTGNSWSTYISGPVSAKKDTVDASAILKADDKWQGDAAGAHAGKGKLHQTYLEKIVTTYTTTASAALETARGGLMRYYTGLVTALGALVGSIIGAWAIGAFYALGTLLKSDCTTAQTSLIQKMSDNNGFPNESWPAGAVL